MASSSSTSSTKKKYMYDVFLSFRGEDTRKNFVDHLNVALQQQGIRTFKDDERLEKGKKINYELLKSIEESRLYIIILSKNYASSSWCLDELVKLMECHNSTTAQIAYPVFYDVDPSEVRKQVGPVGEAFSNHKNKEEMAKWKAALKEASNLAGWDLRNTCDGHEAKVIKAIVEKISLELRFTNLEVDEKLVGMESRINDIVTSLEMCVEDVRMLGIKGMGGSGKTTLAQVVFDSICSSFEGNSFVENVRETSKASVSGLLALQKQVLSGVFNNNSFTIGSVHEGKSEMRKMCGKKVLLILDDVDDVEQLDALAGGLDWFKPGSRIIITTRDEQVLVAHGVKLIHDVNLFSKEEAMCLFSRKTFGSDSPPETYKELSLQVVHYAAGLPLTIKVLGSFLCGKDRVEWIDAVDRLKTIPLNETLKKLELSYTSLEDDFKEIFLDVACLMKGWEINEAIRALESCGFSARIGLKVLEQKSLITISPDWMDVRQLGMHDHIEEMGRNIVRRSHPHEPIKHSRLWIEEEIEDVLSHDLVTEATRAIVTRISENNIRSKVLTKSFGNLKKLRFLHVDCDAKVFDQDELFVRRLLYRLPFGLGPCLPNALQFLSWKRYPHRRLPASFDANNLGVLKMPESKIKKLWGSGHKKVLKNLKVLDLQRSELTTLDCGLLPNLQELDISWCRELVKLHVPSTGCLTRLVYLNASWCNSTVGKQLQSLVKQLQSVQVLYLSHLDLTEFPNIGLSSHCLLKLDFSSNDIKEVPSSIGNLEKLVHLNLSQCKKLKSLPQSICKLRCLKELYLRFSEIEELPEDLGNLESLVELHLDYSDVIKHLPGSICKLKHLKTLDLHHCFALMKLPEDLGLLESLEVLDLERSLIRDVPSSICKLKQLRELRIAGCGQLVKLPEKLGDLKCLQQLDVTKTNISHLPESISLLKDLKIIRSTPELIISYEELERRYASLYMQ